MSRRSYAGAAARAPLTVGIDNIALSMTTAGLVNWPDGTGGPFAVCIDRDTPIEEKVLASSSDGTNIAILQRGYDGTTAQPHSVGAIVEHIYTAIDANEANRHVNSVGGEHGIGPLSAFVGTLDTQTLENKTIDGGLNTVRNLPISAMPGLDAEITGKAQPLVDAETLARQNADAAHIAAADPHPQYQTQAEDDARYLRKSLNLSDLASVPTARANLGLDSAAQFPVTAFDPSGQAASTMAAHVAQSDPHPQYATDTDLTNLANSRKRVWSGTLSVPISTLAVGSGAGPFNIDWSFMGFASVPNATCSVSNAPGGSAGLVPRIINKTTSGGQVYVYNDGTASATCTLQVDWIVCEV